MATLNPDSPFQSWVLTPREKLQGQILSVTQKQCIQNQICQCAQEKMSMIFTPNDLNTFMQREAELQGSIGALQNLLSLSDQAEVELGMKIRHVEIFDPIDPTNPNPQEN